MNLSSKIYIAGHTGMVGSAIVRSLQERGFYNIITMPHEQLDLTRQSETEAFFSSNRPEFVFIAAALVGGIGANINFPADFLMQNLLINCNIIDCAYKYGVKKVLFIGSSCAYPKEAQQPIMEESLLTGPFELTNEGFAISKVAGIKLCSYYRKQFGSDFISMIPCNLYGYNDNFDPNNSHLAAGMLQKFHLAKTNGQELVTIWGTGKALRELLFADDLADASIFLMEHYSSELPINVGFGIDYTILEIAQLIKKIVGFSGNILLDVSKPDGMYRKLIDSSKLNTLGWKPKISLEQGLALTYKWYIEAMASPIH